MATSGSSTRRRVPACIGQLRRGQLLEAPYEGCVQRSERRVCCPSPCRGSVMRKSETPKPFTKKVLEHPPPGLHCRQDKSSQDLRVGFYAKITRLDSRLRQAHTRCRSACGPQLVAHEPCQRVTYPPLESGPSCYYHSSNSLICWPVTDNKYSTRYNNAVTIILGPRER